MSKFQKRNRNYISSTYIDLSMIMICWMKLIINQLWSTYLNTHLIELVVQLNPWTENMDRMQKPPIAEAYILTHFHFLSIQPEYFIKPASSWQFVRSTPFRKKNPLKSRINITITSSVNPITNRESISPSCLDRQTQYVSDRDKWSMHLYFK